LGGAVLGHEVAKSGCRTSGHANYRSRHSRYASARSGEQGRKVYYDQHGDAVVEPGSRDHR
ncbi:hypothetical protein, partial [Phenylobacterium sp.]|uniref:hypothetical protein n=1 Tax=Phenylobacterium sp. TaxID=1871053 RepID=UPI0038620A6F